jgi:hypothetical protein
MMGRLGLLVVTLFWVTMNVLLWRNEFAGSNRGGSPVALEGVVERLLTSPDPATLEVRQNGKPVGFFHWYPDPGEEPNRIYAGDYVPEGMVKSARGLLLRLDGNVSPPGTGTRLRVDLELRLATNRVWSEFNLVLGTRTAHISIRAHHERQTLDWRITRDRTVLEDRIDLREATDPEKLLAQLAGPMAAWISGPWTAALPQGADRRNLLDADARLDWMPLGSSKVRIYRVRVRLAKRYEAVLVINRAGEVLRVDLPGGWRLVNEGLTSF